MALQTALTGDQLNAIRSGRYQALQYVCVVPNEVVVQFQPDEAPSTSVYAEIAVGSIVSGSMSNIKQEQTVIYSTTTNYQATEVFRTRVRTVSGTTTLYVGENSQSLTTSHYVTVLNTYEIQEKLRKSETYADWDIAFRLLLPIETALPSAVVLSNGVITYTPTASAIVMDASASTIDTHAWESSNSNDSFDDDTIAQPEITLEAGSFRWLRYTFTDDNGNSNFRVIPVWTVPKNYDNPYVITGFISESGDVASISFDAELGWTATVTAWDGIEDLINKTFTVVASDEWYNDTRQSIRTNIDFVGFLQNENTPTRGDDAVGRLSETTFTVESFGHQLARQNIASIRIAAVSGTPAAWNEIQNPTPARMLTYHLTEGSTLFHLCSMTIPSDDTDFVGDDLSITGGKAYDDVRFIAEVINAELQFDVNGKQDLCRNLNFLDDTARDAAAVAATLSPSDVLDYAIEYDYSKTTSQLTMTGGAYDSASDEYDLYEAIAPAVARLGEGDPLEVVNQVLTTDSTAAEALAEISERASNFFAYNNPTPTLRATLKDEWHFIVPDIGSWWKFDIALTDTARGRVFSTDDRWQLVERSVSTNNESGRRTVTATFRHETQSTGAMVRARQILTNPNADIIYYPAVLAPFTGADLDYTDGRYFDGVDMQPPSDDNPTDAGCEQGGFRVTEGAYETDSVAETSETIIPSVRGSGVIGYSEIDSFTIPANQSNFTSGSTTLASGVEYLVVIVGNIINGASQRADPQYQTNNNWVSQIRNNLINFEGLGTIDSDDPTYTGTHSYDYTIEGSGSALSAKFSDINYADNSLSFSVTVYEPVYGDALYYWTDSDAPTPYPDGFGLLIEGFQPASIPPYDPSHEYALDPMEVTSGPVLYEYEPLFGTGNLENWSIQVETCFTNP